MRQLPRVIAAERIVQNLHTRQLECPPKRHNLWRDGTEILRDEGERTELLTCSGEHFSPWLRTPHPTACRSSTCRNLIGVVKANEVINTDTIETPQRASKSAAPPIEALSTMRLPAIMWMAPQLAVRGKTVGRHPCHNARASTRVETKQSWIRCDICAVKRDEDRHITKEAYTPTGSVRAQAFPLTIKLKLQEGVIPMGILLITRPTIKPCPLATHKGSIRAALEPASETEHFECLKKGRLLRGARSVKVAPGMSPSRRQRLPAKTRGCSTRFTQRSCGDQSVIAKSLKGNEKRFAGET